MESHKKYLSIKNFAFSLIEILIVLAIITLAVGTIITVIKPTSTFQKSRDAKRETELRTIEKFISSMLANDPTFNELDYVSTNTLYLSLPDSSSTCGSYTNQLPSLPSGWSYRCSATPTDITGQGWIPIPFSSNPLINASQLPIDPLNKPPYYYTFTANSQGYELTAKRENKDEEIIVSNLTSRLTPISRGGTWMKTYGGNNYDDAYSISQTSDGGYVVAGQTSSYGAGGYDILILKLDSSGNVQWLKTYGTSGNEYAYSISQTSDGGYIVAGYHNTNDALILKLSSTGNLQWTKSFDSLGRFYSLVQTSDGGYIVTGEDTAPMLLVVKLDFSGNLQWAKTMTPPALASVGRSISQTSDGGYIVAGYTWGQGLVGENNDFYSRLFLDKLKQLIKVIKVKMVSAQGVPKEIFILKLNSSGDVQWAKKIGTSNNDLAFSISPTSDGGYIVAGETDISGNWDFLIIKLDSNANLQWVKKYGGSTNDYSRSISQSSDGGYIVAGYSNSFGVDFDFLVIKIDQLGNLQWARKIGGNNDDYAYSLSRTLSDNYVIVGSSADYISPSDVLIAKLDSFGNISNCSLNQSISLSSSTPSLSFSTLSLSSSTPFFSSSSPSLSFSSPSLSSQKICPTQ